MQFFGQTMDNVKKHKDIKLVTTEERRSCLASKTKYLATISFFQKFISHRNEKNISIFMNKRVLLGLSLLEISKILMHEFWYDYV